MGLDLVGVLFLHDAEDHFQAALHDVVMLAGRCTLLNQRALDDLLPACADRGVSVLAAAVFNSACSPRRDPPWAHSDYAPASAQLLQRAHGIADGCQAHGVTLPQAAMAFPLSHPAVAGIVVGMRSAEEVRRNLTSLAWTRSPQAAPPWVWWTAVCTPRRS
jgi:D-threo-aldose 1-dehydrogenase